MERLSSGMRIVRPSDDAAGLGISERFRSQIKNTAMAALNVENVISFIQTKDSWMQRITDMVNRMGELAVQSNDGTKSTGDRVNIQQEINQLQKEVARITSHYTAAGKYNGLYLFRGATGEGQAGTRSARASWSCRSARIRTW
jgi:flagellin